MITVEIFIAMNEDGGWVVGNDESEMLSKLNEEEGGYQARVVKLIVKMSPPVMAEAETTIPDETGQIVKVKAR